MQGRLALRASDPEDRVAAVMARHGRLLLRVANHWSLCHDDALDAYQRALEIFLRRADTVHPATEVAWLKVVVKHEALAIRRSRQDSVSGEEIDLERESASTERSLDDRVAGGERVSRSAEALRALKPDERRALMLKAEGYSYNEIGERLGWTYTKVNRAITEGRRRFMEVYRAIESGEACERFAPTIAALADGSASSAEVVEIRPHLRHCSACRATVRELHLSAAKRLQLFLPGALLAPLASLRGRGGEVSAYPDEVPPPEELIREVARPDLPAAPDPQVIDLGGQLALPRDLPERLEHARRHWLGRIKDEALALAHRGSSTDVATGIGIATTGGGGRIAAVATLIGFCVSGVGAGALCVATGVVKAPGWIFPAEERARAPKPVADPPAARFSASTRASEVVATPTPTPGPTHRSSELERHRRTPDRSQDTTPTSHESSPISPAATASTSEFGFEAAGGGGGAGTPPASAPATGGGEFTP